MRALEPLSIDWRYVHHIINGLYLWMRCTLCRLNRTTHVQYRLTYEYLCAESARLVLPWHLRGRTGQLITCGTVQLFFNFVLHLVYFCYNLCIDFSWELLFFSGDTQIRTIEEQDYKRTVYLLDHNVTLISILFLQIYVDTSPYSLNGTASLSL